MGRFSFLTDLGKIFTKQSFGVSADTVKQVSKNSVNKLATISTKVGDDLLVPGVSKTASRAGLTGIKNTVEEGLEKTAIQLAKDTPGLTEDVAKKGLKDMGEKSSRDVGGDIADMFIESGAKKGTKNSTKMTAKKTFKTTLGVMAASTVVGYGVYRAIQSYINYEDKVDQTYNVTSIKVVSSVARLAETVLPEYIAKRVVTNLPVSSNVVLIKYDPKTKLAKGDGIELGAVSEVDEGDVQPVSTGTILDGYVWTVTNINTPGEALIDTTEHGIDKYASDEVINTGTMKVHSSYGGTFIHDLREDTKSAIGGAIDLAADTLSDILDIDADTLVVVMWAVITIIALIVLGSGIVRLVRAYREISGNRGTIKHINVPPS